MKTKPFNGNTEIFSAVFVKDTFFEKRVPFPGTWTKLLHQIMLCDDTKEVE